jgi:hypothetical protein
MIHSKQLANEYRKFFYEIWEREKDSQLLQNKKETKTNQKKQATQLEK